MKKISNLLFLPLALCLSACTLLPANSSQNPGSSGNTPNPSDSNAPSDSSPQDLGDDCVFHTSGVYLPFEGFNVAINDLKSGMGNRDDLKDAINKEVGSTLLTSISADSCTILSDNGEKDKEHYHLGIGTGSSGGYIEFTFSKNVSKIEVTCSAYYKVDYTCDTNATLYIDTDKNEVPNDGEYKEQETHVFSKEYSTKATTIKLSNTTGKQRVYVNSIHLYF